ncbi:MAG: hypothetical protein EBU08_15055 [Micrococcales bacterium]|nr:hypothetical protein [Micrococcales bacterium]
MTDITIINVATGQVVKREYTEEEKNLRSELESSPPQEIISVRLQEESLQNSEYVALKQSAINKLKALGLTEEEARAIAGL